MLKTKREEFLPQWAAVTLSLAVGLILFGLLGFFFIGVWAVEAGIIWYPPIQGAIALCVLIAVIIVASWLPARTLYFALRWRDVEVENTFCPNCDYNLTGNTSGICPACGKPIDKKNEDSGISPG